MDANHAALAAILLDPTLTVDEARREAFALAEIRQPAPRSAGPRRAVVSKPTPRPRPAIATR